MGKTQDMGVPLDQNGCWSVENSSQGVDLERSFKDLLNIFVCQKFLFLGSSQLRKCNMN